MVLYLILGFIQLFIIDLVIFRIKQLGKVISITHSNRLAIILIWPIWTFFFWYNFFKELIKNV
jgi:hypothetical protein